MHESLIIVACAAGVLLALVGHLANRRYRRRSRSADAGFAPRNFSAWMRLWRQRRADEGKGDNWLTKPVIRIGPESSDDDR